MYGDTLESALKVNLDNDESSWADGTPKREELDDNNDNDDDGNDDNDDDDNDDDDNDGDNDNYTPPPLDPADLQTPSPKGTPPSDNSGVFLVSSIWHMPRNKMYKPTLQNLMQFVHQRANQLLELQPEHINQWLCMKTYKKRHLNTKPGRNRPIHRRLSTLKNKVRRLSVFSCSTIVLRGVTAEATHQNVHCYQH